ncbi:MAG: acyl--CoA ligase [Clostridiales bacterium]|nr:acyl--CoA ligase [Clostridiales bacterium]
MLWEYIEEKMLRHPDSTLKEGDACITYKGAVAFAKEFAKRLEASCYGILCRSELSGALAILSCIAAGATFLPLSYRYGRKHCENIFQTVHPEYMITDIIGELRPVKLDDGTYREPVGERPAAILCTSGTTGKPKGIMLSEKNLCTNLSDIRRYFAIGPADKILISRSLYHCAVLTGELLTSLCQGTHVHFFSESFRPGEILRKINAEEITVLCGTPTMLTALARFERRAVSEDMLRTIAISGECLDAARARTIRDAFPAAKIYHVYGLTEASPRVTFLPPEQFAVQGTCVGYPLHSLQLRVVNQRGKAVCVGETGELCVRGDSVMMGYYNDPAATAAVLRGGWLHTGDMAVMSREGLVKIRGRKDNMIIRGGMNIYPQEIEKSLSMDTRVREVMAYGISDPLFGEKIGLRIAGNFAGRGEVLRMCRRMLLPYQMPAVVELMDELPKNGAGKIIRKKGGRRAEENA